jgi:uncharacterized membrane protein
MLEEQQGRSGAEPVLDGAGEPMAGAPIAGAPQGAVSRPAGPRASRPAGPREERIRPGVYRDPVTWAIALAAFGAYGAISLFRLLQLNPSSWDLGIYTEYVKQLAHFHAPIVDIRAAGFNLLGDHFQPAVAVLAPLFRIFPSSATLLIAQALLIAVSVFPVSQVAREKLGVGPGRAIAAAYAFSWGLQQVAQFDFHEIAFAVPLLAFSLSALVRGHTRATVWWALPLVFVKEDQGFTVAAIGLYLVITGLTASDGRGRVVAGQFLVIWGFAWSYVAIGVIIPHFNPAHQYPYWSDGGLLAPGGHPSVAGLVGQLFRAWPDKLLTVVTLLLPTAFIALGSPVALIALPSLLLRFMSTDSSFWGTYWHYNATVMPILFIAAVDALARIGAAMDADEARAGVASWASGRQGPWRAALAGARRYGAAMMIAIAVALAFQFPLSKLWNAPTYSIGPHVAAAEAAMAKVPDGATVLTTLDLLAPLAARTDTFWIGNSGNPETQYIVFDGLDSDYSPAIKNVPDFIAGLYPDHAYTLIFSSGDVYVFRRDG